MKIPVRMPLMLLLITSTYYSLIFASEGQTPRPKPGSNVGTLQFKDIRYLTRSLSDFKEQKAFVLIACNTTCPLVKRYLPKLKRLEQKYGSQGVQFIALHTGPFDSIREIAEFGIEQKIPFPNVQDIKSRSIDALGLERTPEVAVLDAHFQLRYRGRIDNQYRIGGSLPQPTQNNLVDALEAVLKNEPVKIPETNVDGCTITPHTPKRAAKLVTYYDDIQPLMKKHCVDCHRPQTEAPFALTSLKEVQNNGAMIADVVADQRMPPWYGATAHAEFANHRSMSRKERALVVDWFQAGMPAGEEPTQQTTTISPQARKKWIIGEPDLKISMLETHSLPAEGYIPYRYTVLPFVFPEDTWVSSIEILPDNPNVVHHCNMGAVSLTRKWDESNFITGKVPGSGPTMLPDGLGILIPKGSALGLQIHYTSTGKPEKCKISVGFKYVQGKVQKRYRFLIIKNTKFKIPPGAPHHEVSNSKTLDRDAHGIGLFAHMHLRGKDLSFLAHYPEGKDETLLVIPNYNFDWQIGYLWKDQRNFFPKGTRVEAIAHYDNSAFNPYNPDPTARVRNGPQTYHEMMYAFFFYTYANEQLNLAIDPKTGQAIN
ncbi:redoxin domain-containing protein [uncultured Gimesia sp.]|uniref:redoxin domain-containing protein n=1 Tax=uncultured Gimesia sp. TaxID=1678688 RepID=UPI0030D8F527|tara:strand:+ start:37699 stop:39492 length:1794 start_codon:yes stop_codon:yes gene_type:complete